MHPDAPASRIAVIVPTWRRRELLLPLYQHFRKQTFKDWAMVVVYVDTNDVHFDWDDKRIHYQRSPIPGASAQRNEGVLYVEKHIPSAQYIAFFDDDDVPTPDYLEKMAFFLEVNPKARFASCNLRLGADNHIQGTGTPAFLWRKEFAKPVWEPKPYHDRIYAARMRPGWDIAYPIKGDIHIDRILVTVGNAEKGGLRDKEGSL